MITAAGTAAAQTVCGAAPDFLFGTIYRLRRWTGTGFEPLWTGGRFLSSGESPARLFAS